MNGHHGRVIKRKGGYGVTTAYSIISIYIISTVGIFWDIQDCAIHICLIIVKFLETSSPIIIYFCEVWSIGKQCIA